MGQDHLRKTGGKCVILKNTLDTTDRYTISV